MQPPAKPVPAPSYNDWTEVFEWLESLQASAPILTVYGNSLSAFGF